jgi:hypothetical protein
MRKWVRKKRTGREDTCAVELDAVERIAAMLGGLLYLALSRRLGQEALLPTNHSAFLLLTFLLLR